MNLIIVCLQKQNVFISGWFKELSHECYSTSADTFFLCFHVLCFFTFMIMAVNWWHFTGISTKRILVEKYFALIYHYIGPCPFNVSQIYGNFFHHTTFNWSSSDLKVIESKILCNVASKKQTMQDSTSPPLSWL